MRSGVFFWSTMPICAASARLTPNGMIRLIRKKNTDILSTLWHSPPTGAIRLARKGGNHAGCGQYQRLAPGTVESKRVDVNQTPLGSGAEYANMSDLINTPRSSGHKRIRMDRSQPLRSAPA